MNEKDSITFTHTGFITRKDKRIISCRFERGKHFAEGILPDCIIEESFGFSSEETEQLADFLKANRKDIIEKAKELSDLRNIL